MFFNVCVPVAIGASCCCRSLFQDVFQILDPVFLTSSASTATLQVVSHLPHRYTPIHSSIMAILSNDRVTASIEVLASVGALFVFLKLFSFVRLIFSLFILPGKSVRAVICPQLVHHVDPQHSSQTTDPKAAGLSSQEHQTVLAKNTLYNSPHASSMSSSSLALPPSSMRLPLISPRNMALRQRHSLWTTPRTLTPILHV